MPSGLILTRDLFFASKVTGTAGALGLTMRSVGSRAQFRDALASADLTLVILDLDWPELSPPDVLAELPPGRKIATVAFGPHVHAEKLAAAAGFQRVLPRSRFSAELPEILKRTLAESAEPEPD
jgi:hypothetical protein